MSIDIYKENILDHYKNPHNFGKLENFNFKASDSNPVCGDSFTIELRTKKKQIEDAKFTGHGCAISTASASMLTEKIKKMSINNVKKLNKEDVIDLLGIELSHVRIKCAMLPLKIIKLALYNNNFK